MNKKQIENLIYDYHWKKREMDRLEKILFDMTIPLQSIKAIEYSIEATLPKGNALKSEAELNAMDLREKRLYKRWESYREEVFVIELIVDSLQGEYELIIIDCMMEGMSYRAISMHLGKNRNQIREIKDDMLDQICQKCHFLHDLNKDKSCV